MTTIAAPIIIAAWFELTENMFKIITSISRSALSRDPTDITSAINYSILIEKELE